jgi:galactokinase
VIHEQARVIEAVIALRAGNMEQFGKLMFASHHSLKELYEVTGKELDAIVDFCQGYDSCRGARMTGAGFGGCAIALVRKEDLADFSQKLSLDYKSKIGFFVTGLIIFITLQVVCYKT